MEEVHAEDLDDEETEEGPRPVTVGRNFQELPEGHLTLVGFAKFLAKPRSQGGRYVLVKPQVLYSTAKNTKSFPVKTHVDGRQIVNVEEALQWWDEKEARKAERAADAEAQQPEPDEEVTA
jgi:hypothetical protein